MNIAIRIFPALQHLAAIDPEREWNNVQTYFNTLIHTHGKPSDCIRCGQCEAVCPQHLPIIEDLVKVSDISSERDAGGVSEIEWWGRPDSN